MTKQERDEFLSDNIDAIEGDRLTVLSQEKTIDDDIDPISSIVEEIVKNETIIGDEEFVPSPESSIIKFKDQNLEQILAAQEVAPEPDNQTISTTEEEELPLNVTEDDFEIEQADEISESESPDVDVQSFINETANEETTTTTTAPPTDNETAITTEDTDEEEEEEETTTTTTAPPTDNETAITTEDTDEEEEEEETTTTTTAPPTDNETAITTEDTDEEEEEETTTTTTAPPTDNETAITTEDTDEEEEEETTTTTTAPPTDNETAITTEDSVEGKPSELLEMDPEAEDEIQDIKGEQQTEQAQQEEEDEAQTPQVEEESPNTEPIAQDGSVTTAQNQQLNIKLNANDADGDDLSFTIVDDPSNGQLGNVNPSTNTVTYTPDEDYSGEDNFTFIVNDGTIDSKEATVSITVEEEQQTEQAQQEEEDSQQEEDED